MRITVSRNDSLGIAEMNSHLALWEDVDSPQMIRSVIAFNTARVRSRVPSLSRMVET